MLRLVLDNVDFVRQNASQCSLLYPSLHLGQISGRCVSSLVLAAQRASRHTCPDKALPSQRSAQQLGLISTMKALIVSESFRGVLLRCNGFVADPDERQVRPGDGRHLVLLRLHSWHVSLFSSSLPLQAQCSHMPGGLPNSS